MPKDLIVPGRVLADRYRLDELLGEGGFGTVWVAHHLVLEAPVAVKLIDPEIAEDELAVERFLREAKAAASLRSPHVVQILDYGVDEGQPFIAMELLEGETLAQRIKREGQIEAREALRILGHIARAIGRAHEAGVVHRDLKPENVFLIRNDDEEIAKVLDFGVAKFDANRLGVKSTATRTGSLLGTPFYMSPEQVLGNKEVDFRSDLWSMGVIAFEMMTGKRPFVSDGLGDLVLQITVHPLPVPSQFAPVAAGFDDWFARAMTRDPAHRLGSARELVESLRETLDLGSDSADAVVTVPEPGEDPPALAVTRGLPTRQDPTRRLAVSTAPTVLADGKSGRVALATSTPEGEAESPDAEEPPPPPRSGRNHGESATVSQFTSPADPPRGRSPVLAIAIAVGALAIGLLGGLLALNPRQEPRPLPVVGAPGFRSESSPASSQIATDRPLSVMTPRAESSAADPAPSAEGQAEGELAAVPSQAPGGSATARPASDADEPPPEWLPREVDGGIVKPEWARVEAPDAGQPVEPPTPAEPPTPYD